MKKLQLQQKKEWKMFSNKETTIQEEETEQIELNFKTLKQQVQLQNPEKVRMTIEEEKEEGMAQNEIERNAPQ